MLILDLFSGTHSISKACLLRPLWKSISVDLQNADINVDILVWDYQKILKPGQFDLVWASPPCRYFSNLRKSNVGRFNITKESLYNDMIEKGLPLLRKAQEILSYLQPRWYVIENPDTGDMKKFMKEYSYCVMDYCCYSDWGYRKRTRFWSNLIIPNPLLCQGKNLCINMIKSLNSNRWSHKLCTDGGKSNKRGTTRLLRYRVPPLLIQEFLKVAENEHWEKFSPSTTINYTLTHSQSLSNLHQKYKTNRRYTL